MHNILNTCDLIFFLSWWYMILYALLVCVCVFVGVGMFLFMCEN